MATLKFSRGEASQHRGSRQGTGVHSSCYGRGRSPLRLARRTLARHSSIVWTAIPVAGWPKTQKHCQSLGGCTAPVQAAL